MSWHEMELVLYELAQDGTGIIRVGTRWHWYYTNWHKMALVLYELAGNGTGIIQVGTKWHWYYARRHVISEHILILMNHGI